MYFSPCGVLCVGSVGCEVCAVCLLLVVCFACGFVCVVGVLRVKCVL